MSDALAALRAARRETAEACAWLSQPCPNRLELSSAALARAVSAIEGWSDDLENLEDFAEAQAEAVRLREAVRKGRRLLDNAAEFHRGWRQLLGSMVSGYTSQGEAAPVAASGRLVLEV